MSTPLTLTYVHLGFFQPKKTLALLDLLAEKMEKECGFPAGEIFDTMTLAKTGVSKSTSNKTAFAILHDGKELYCASLMSHSNILTRWVPPKHRHRGYAVTMLHALEALIQSVEHSHLPLWIVSYDRMAGINTRAGWIRNDTVNIDRRTGKIPDKEEDYQHDWMPAWSKEGYDACLAASKTKGPDPFTRVFNQQWLEFVLRHGGRKDLNLKVRF